MVLLLASIIFNDSASQFNKDLTDFLRRNVEIAIKRGGLSFDYKIVKPADLAELNKKGINRLPAMMIGSRSYIGVPDIIQEIRERVKNSVQNVPEKSEDEIVHEYQMNEINQNVSKNSDGKFQIVEDKDRDESTELNSRFAEEMKRRGGTQSAPTQPANPDRNPVQDYDEFDHRPTQPQQTGSYGAPPIRHDNIDIFANPAMADAMESLANTKKGFQSVDSAKDDEMMAALLSKME